MLPLFLLFLHFWCGTEICYVSPSTVPDTIIKAVAIWGVRGAGVKGDMFAEMFSQPRLCSVANVAWHRVLLTDVRSFSSYPLDLDQDNPLLALSVVFCVEFGAMCEDEGRHNLSITSDQSKYHDMNWMFGFHHYEHESVF